MTTAAEVKLIVAPLLAQNPDVVLIGRVLALKPIKHTLRGAAIGNTSNKLHFEPMWFSNILCYHIEQLYFIQCERMIQRFKGAWSLDNPAAIADLNQQLHDEVFPLLRPVVTITDHAKLFTRENFPMMGGGLSSHYYNAILDAALGRVERLDAYCDFLDEAAARLTARGMGDLVSRMQSQFCPLVRARDWTGLARLLHEWEALSVKNLKITHLWEPTPFPLEDMFG